MKYKLGLDLGSTSLGWAAVKLNDAGAVEQLLDFGVRIFPDGRDAKTHAPINVVRRAARTMRRRGDRVKLRKKRVLQLIRKYGLDFDIRSNPILENPYELRVRALEHRLSPSELGRVLFHLALRRGFKSNRKETKGENGGKLKAATDALASAVGDGTLAQFQVQTKKFRFSNQFDGNVIKDGALYPTRDMYLDEFHRICDAQGLDKEMRAAFENAIFFQRPLIPPVVGTCIFAAGQPRAHKFEPVFQRWRALQQLNQLAILDNGQNVALTDQQRQCLVDILLYNFNGVKRDRGGRVKITFAEIKKQLGLSRTVKFNLESEQRKELNVDSTGFSFAEIGELDFWRSLTDEQQSDVLNKINDDQTEDAELIEYLVAHYGLSASRARAIIDIPLEDDVANVSVVAMKKMLPFLEGGQLYHLAVHSAGYHYGEQDVPLMDKLPYYGDLDVLKPSLMPARDGAYRTMNATVHIAMNQIRVVVNDLIERYGRPCAINIELGRDVRAGAKERAELDKQQSANKRKNDAIRAELAEIGILNPSREDFQKYKLWENLAPQPQNRRCVYTGEPITSLAALFKSGRFEIEHILPFAQTLDDSLANKTISAVAANRFKGNRSPAEAFDDPASPWAYADVWARAQNLPDGSRWRFDRDAMEKFTRHGDCIARALNDTRFMSVMAVNYLKHICSDKNKVRGLPGRLTAIFRDMWHLGWWKNHDDADTYRASHIHHAIDAFVIACMGAGNLQKLAENATHLEDFHGKTLKEKHRQLFADMYLPFPEFDYYDFRMRCEACVISYRPSVKEPAASDTVGCLHEDTAYKLEKFETGTRATMSRRIALPTTADARAKFKKDFDSLNPKTLEMFLAETGVANDANDIADQFLNWCQMRGIKKVRMFKTRVDTTTYVPVFRNRGDKNAFNRAWTEWYAAAGIARGMTEPKAKKAQQEKERRLLALYQNAAARAYKWFVSGNNFCADIFEIRSDDRRYPALAGQWQSEIISNYCATLNNGTPMWRCKYATARRVMRLRINDMVMAEFSRDNVPLLKGLEDAVRHQLAVQDTDTVNIIFRVKKISSNGAIFLRPHYIAKEDADPKTWQANATSLQKYKARKIRVSPTGKVLE